MKIVIILSHEMDHHGKLKEESIKRANLGIKIFHDKNCDFILTLGWSYRKDTELPIASAVKSYINEMGIPIPKIISDINSRDTVGDAIFSKLLLEKKYSPEKLYVVSSDYHIERVKMIFNSIYTKQFKIEFFGCCTNANQRNKIKEQESSSAFLNTFGNIDFTNNEILLDRLKSQHPFYNGKVFPKFRGS